MNKKKRLRNFVPKPRMTLFDKKARRHKRRLAGGGSSGIEPYRLILE